MRLCRRDILRLFVPSTDACFVTLPVRMEPFVDGHRVLGVYLRKSVPIVVGETQLTFESLDEEVELPLSRKMSFGGLLGHSEAMRSTFAVLEAAAKSDATVLILGESGTGKELAARAVHERSGRSEGPLVVFDCSTAAATLVESQLFGHSKGAFTGATESREGVFEAANGGTLVLDEIGELPLNLQSKLLRALESREVVRLGETKSRNVDVRFIASTNRNLQEEVKAGRFREDLFFRLSVVTARLPPLRDRKEEIPRLCSHFLTAIAGDRAPEIPSQTMELVLSHDWPGNCRELRNFVERFLALPGLPAGSLLGSPSEDDKRTGAPDVQKDEPFHAAKERFTDRFEYAYFERLLKNHGENISEAARVAGLSRQTCYRMIRKHGLKNDD